MKNTILALIVLTLFAGCSKSEKCNYDPCGVKAPDSEVASVKAYLDANNITAIKHCSGLYYTIDQQGNGKNPEACSSVSVTYVGRLTNGTQFDASGPTPVSFNLSGVIRGWTSGVPLGTVGGKITLYIPPSLGYGAAGNGPVPPNAITIFNISIVAAQ